jgi:hypothetical protein
MAARPIVQEHYWLEENHYRDNGQYNHPDGEQSSDDCFFDVQIEDKESLRLLKAL